MKKLGKSGIEVSALGMGCWAIGGPFSWDGNPVGWGRVDDAESLRAVQRALELGVTLFDTAAVYGCGHSERSLGQALKGHRAEVVITTKFGIDFDEAKREVIGVNMDITPDYVRASCEASLKRLGTDYLDVLQLHPAEYETARAHEVRDVLEGLVKEGLIRTYGWSITHTEGVEIFAEGEHCTVTQNQLHVLDDQPEFLAVCERLNVAWLCRGPLAMGLLTGKYSQGSKVGEDDMRGGWDTTSGAEATQLKQLAELRELLTQDGRSLAQGALGWVLARSALTIPIPGFKSVEQVEENAGTLAVGPLDPQTMTEIEKVTRNFTKAASPHG